MISHLVLMSAHLLEWVVPRVTGRFRVARSLTHSRFFQPALARAGRLRARAVYLKAVKSCPAYRDFVGEEGERAGRGRWRMSSLPVTSKDDYVKRYGIDARCYGGRIPSGAVLDESAGSTGPPCNWVRSVDDREYQRRVTHSIFKYRYGLEGGFVLNCVALGTWAVGVALSMSAAGLTLLKSVGPNAQKLEDTLVEFGKGYRYLLFAYAPFAKHFVNRTRLELGGYDLSLVVLGEPLSEPLRDFLLGHFKTVISAFGATDLDPSMAGETRLTIALRRMCAADPRLSLELFGRETPPMIFQYDPFEYVVETTEEGQLLFTVARLRSAAPKIRYNLHDLGGTMTFAELAERLAARGVEISRLAAQHSALPILYVHGRDDYSVSVCGVDLRPTHVEQIICAHPEMVRAVNSFCLMSYEDERVDQRVKICLELTDERDALLPPPVELRGLFFEALTRFNPDFRTTLEFANGAGFEVECYESGTGPFAESGRAKNLYIRRVAKSASADERRES
ncbi:MAG TPA: hypothetical protein VFX96_04285 [Pyrinomonadaceae bacterium]|nr:hypothetical protein [Pyrinomonadaceae bacterium]